MMGLYRTLLFQTALNLSSQQGRDMGFAIFVSFNNCINKIFQNQSLDAIYAVL